MFFFYDIGAIAGDIHRREYVRNGHILLDVRVSADVIDLHVLSAAEIQSEIHRPAGYGEFGALVDHDPELAKHATTLEHFILLLECESGSRFGRGCENKIIILPVDLLKSRIAAGYAVTEFPSHIQMRKKKGNRFAIPGKDAILQ
jgi:hypothetical protein